MRELRSAPIASSSNCLRLHLESEAATRYSADMPTEERDNNKDSQKDTVRDRKRQKKHQNTQGRQHACNESTLSVRRERKNNILDVSSHLSLMEEIPIEIPSISFHEMKEEVIQKQDSLRILLKNKATTRNAMPTLVQKSKKPIALMTTRGKEPSLLHYNC